MPDLRIVSWNSRGEDAFKVNDLANTVAWLANQYPGYPDVDVFVIQEAQNGPGGAIDVWLNALPGYAVTHIAENLLGGGKGYICATRTATVAVITPLVLWNYAADPNFALFPYRAHLQASVWTGSARVPAYTILTVGGQNVLLVTWHAPRGPSALPIIVGAMSGGAIIDAYLALDNSQLLQAPATLAMLAGNAPDITIIAGDMNATSAGLNYNYFGYTPLENFAGIDNHLDHVLANAPLGTVVNFQESHNSVTASDHEIISTRISW